MFLCFLLFDHVPFKSQLPVTSLRVWRFPGPEQTLRPIADQIALRLMKGRAFFVYVERLVSELIHASLSLLSSSHSFL